MSEPIPHVVEFAEPSHVIRLDRTQPVGQIDLPCEVHTVEFDGRRMHKPARDGAFKPASLRRCPRRTSSSGDEYRDRCFAMSASGSDMPNTVDNVRARRSASQLIALAPMIAATNVRKIIAWLETGTPEPVRRKRRRDILDDAA
ncbi:hypothetical protein GGQ54_001369 [Naumannella cuiyingiana]|uniref:Uncharacterized protein n=2 Tax=Naumannella cuiyingiana TaxID=1347891 RepID=A0A7Z0D8N5_9ACTN|nr:hypothetical protein [Naumannella cuiyingiana]